MVRRTADMLNYFLLRLVGPKMGELKVWYNLINRNSITFAVDICNWDIYVSFCNFTRWVSISYQTWTKDWKQSDVLIFLIFFNLGFIIWGDNVNWSPFWMFQVFKPFVRVNGVLLVPPTSLTPQFLLTLIPFTYSFVWLRQKISQSSILSLKSWFLILLTYTLTLVNKTPSARQLPQTKDPTLQIYSNNQRGCSSK